MAAASSPNPMNLLLLAGVGIAAFWAFSRMRGQGAAPAPIYPTPAQNQQALQGSRAETDALKYQLAAGLLGKAFDFFGERAKGNDPYSLATGWGTGMANGWGVPLSSDGVAYNPGGNTSAQDSIYSLVGAWKS
ncbi:hypothetical protein [Hydrogenophaga intermedia]|uniref:hypothetical protein n=1 Tax=Hydrogenophaga intermedia TaxID=65786 RepID=UPI0020448D7A|nr:hypothetical protein [Hydrogenophaga intermedia]MCM3565923.1 hypothetical protein [Hydrogenophaga intermedia]